MPAALIALLIAGRDHVTHDPLLLLAFVVATGGGWLLAFGLMSIVGALAFFIESTTLVFEIWFGLFTLCSGYLVPLSLFPDWLRIPLDYLPFRPLLGLPVEILIGRLDHTQTLIGLGVEWAYIALAFAAGIALFNRGSRRGTRPMEPEGPSMTAVRPLYPLPAPPGCPAAPLGAALAAVSS